MRLSRDADPDANADIAPRRLRRNPHYNKRSYLRRLCHPPLYFRLIDSWEDITLDVFFTIREVLSSPPFSSLVEIRFFEVPVPIDFMTDYLKTSLFRLVYDRDVDCL